MFSAIYIEKTIRDHERVLGIIERHPNLPIIECERFGEIFNRNGQNFRLQKSAPALILAEKHGKRVLPTPDGYGFEETDSNGYYFSHMLNCLYDCRYCFLQGMYRSAHYVLFVNYEDFAEEIAEVMGQQKGRPVFYSGYDCDSLAFEPVSQFCDFIIPIFSELSEATLELRTKSTQVRHLLQYEAMNNCVVAMSFAPEAIAKQHEHRVPSLDKRIDALAKLQQAGWPVAIRFEPVIPTTATLADYDALFEAVFSHIDGKHLHSCSLGEYRLPQDFYKRMVKLYPDDSLLARDIVLSDGMISLDDGGSSLLQQLEERLMPFVDSSSYYRCA